MPSNTLKPMFQRTGPLIHTSPDRLDKQALAHMMPHRALLKLLASSTFHPTLLSSLRLQLPKPQCLSPSRLTKESSKCTLTVSSIPLSVVPRLITPLLLSAMDLRMARNTTSLETPGPNLGEKWATSELPSRKVQESVVSKWSPSTHPSRIEANLFLL